MPNIAYQWIEIPWNLQDPVIHRKQKCVLHQRMFIEERYRAVIKVTDQYERHHHFLSNKLSTFTTEMDYFALKVYLIW